MRALSTGACAVLMDGAVDVELSALHSFIEEQLQWLDSVLHTLGWSRESLEQVCPLFLRN